MTHKSIFIAIVITVLLAGAVFGRFHHMVEYRYKPDKAKYEWGEVSGNLFEVSLYNKLQHRLGIGVKTKSIPKGNVSISNVLFTGKEDGSTFIPKDFSKEEKLINNYAALHLPKAILPYEDYAVSFDINLTSNSKTITEMVVLNFQKDYREYNYSIWDMWMGV